MTLHIPPPFPFTGIRITMSRHRLISIDATVVAAVVSALVLISAISPAADELTNSAKQNLPNSIAFNRDIRPILADHCFACHGPDQNKREAELRLDTQSGLIGTADAPAVVVANDLNASKLFLRISAADQDKRMPPAEFSKPLSDRQKELIRLWIDQGAKWEGHWSFQPIRGFPIPAIDDHAPIGFAKNEIDAFTLREMKSHGLNPAPVADRRTLVRRLSFDLTGLPPEPELVERFERDNAPSAYERLVDDFLASPHFGERMAMWWLDLVRYADSVGYHGDQPVSVSPFRDYVIQAFNANKPYDEFTREQLAGDLLPNPTRQQRIASGYNRLGMMSAEGGVQPKEYLSKYIAERVRNLGGTWMGITLGCCECHDHKYDPFSTEEFYRLEAFFADIDEQGLYAGNKWGNEMAVPTDEQAEQLRRLESQIAELKRSLDTQTDELQIAQQNWEKSAVLWELPKPLSMVSAGGATVQLQPDGSVLASGTKPDKDTYTLEFNAPAQGIRALRLEVLPDESLPKKGPGRANSGNFVLTEFKAMLVKEAHASQTTKIELKQATATHEQTTGAKSQTGEKWSVQSAIDGDLSGTSNGWSILDQVGKPHSAVFQSPDSPIECSGHTLVVVLEHQHEKAAHTLGRFRISYTTSTGPVKAGEGLDGELAKIVTTPVAQRSLEEQNKIAAHYRSIAPSLASERERIAELLKQKDSLTSQVTTTLVTATVAPRKIQVLHRGNWMDESGAVVDPGFPKVLGTTPGSDRRLNRLDLADWIVSREHPLTARVAVNRFWKLFFGAGLSPRLDDFGSQGQWPTHPELLDTLSAKFIHSSWNIKELIKKMVMSGTYRQSSKVSAEAQQSDPFNHWLSHQARFRLDAEMVRDNALAVSGLLVDDVGGASVKPYQPPGYWAYLNFPQREWENGKSRQLFRRGLYTHWQRQYLHPALQAFDAPSREECTAERTRSNTPLQSLVLLNDPSFVEAARVLAERVLSEAQADDAERIAWMFRRTLSRAPSEEESNILLNLLSKHRTEYGSAADAAKSLLSIGEKQVTQDLEPVELAAWTSVTRVVFNLHETVTRN